MNREQIVSNAWRGSIDHFAHRASSGRWIRYKWLVHLLRLIQVKIMAGNARIILNAPPRHGKSEAVSHWLPTWYLDWFPENRIILGAYGNSFAKKWGKAVRREFERGEFTRHQLDKSSKEVTDWQLVSASNEGGMRSVSMDGAVTGMGANLLSIDDPHKNWQEAMSPTINRRVIEGYKSDIRTRLEPGGSVLITMTRWGGMDLTGALLEEMDEPWEHFNFPAIAEPNDILGREVGEALCPERFTVEDLLTLKKVLGYKFAGLYQQRPAPIEGNIIKEAWLKHWDVMPECDKYAQSWDLSFGSDSKKASYVVGQLWGKKGPDFFLLDQIREQMNFVEQIDAIKQFSAKWPKATAKYIENKANGAAVISTLKQSIPGLIPVNPQGDKESRLEAVSPLFESGNVYLPPKYLTWVKDVITELLIFPNSTHNDIVDTTSQALSQLHDSVTVSNMIIPNTGVKEEIWSSIYG